MRKILRNAIEYCVTEEAYGRVNSMLDQRDRSQIAEISIETK